MLRLVIYNIMSFKFNYHQKGMKQTNLPDKTVKSIENRQKIAALYNAKEKIEDYQNEVFNIIDKDGLKNNDDNKWLNTALKVLPFIAPQKKQVETTVITRNIEDLIKEDIEEAEIVTKSEQNKESGNID